jgi:hypothetical protein
MFILRTKDGAEWLGAGGAVVPRRDAAPMQFHTADDAYAIVHTQPDMGHLVVDRG